VRFEEVRVRAQNSCSGVLSSFSHGGFEFRSSVKSVHIGLEELSDDVSAEMLAIKIVVGNDFSVFLGNEVGLFTSHLSRDFLFALHYF